MAKAIRNTEQAIEYLKSIEAFEDLEIVDGKVVESRSCWRCGGDGYGHWLPDGGVCYACGGASTRDQKIHTPLKEYAQDTKAKRRAAERQAEKRRKAYAEQLERQKDWSEQNGHGRITFAELDEKRKAEREANKVKSQYVGEIGKRAEFTATIVAVPHYDTRYSRVYVYIMIDSDGNKIIWKTGSGFNATRDETVTFKATVKEHSTREGEKQTVVTRCKEIEAAA